MDEERAAVEPGDRIGRQMLLIGAALVGLIVITVVAVLVAGTRTATFAEDSPEYALQRYLEAFADEDYEAAYGWFSSSVQDQMSLAAFEESARLYEPGFTGDGGPARRVSVDRVEETDDGVRLHIVVDEFYGDGLGGGSYSYERTVRLIREDDAWKIDEPLVGLEGQPVPGFEEAPAEPAP